MPKEPKPFIEIKKELEAKIKQSSDRTLVLSKTQALNNFNAFIEKIVEYTKLSNLYLNLVILQSQNEEKITEINLIHIRKNLNLALSTIGNYVGRIFTSFTNTSKSKKNFFEKIDLLDLFNLLKSIGLTIDRLDNLINYSSKLKISIVELKEKFCHIYLNTIDFKTIIKNMDYENPEHDKYEEVLVITKKIIEETAESFWNLHMKDPRLKGSTIEIKKGINLLEILNKLNIIVNDSKEKEKISKKIRGWETYRKSLIKI